ncbi:hypothetical protein J6590_012372 [Homalodisca vitripennis]|nr:hypothetical protein J6590_012372 [Homalodisca vitripennis]
MFENHATPQSAAPVVSKEVAPVEKTQARPVPISISLLVEQPDIILVENLDDINTNAIIMNVSNMIFAA